MKKKVGVISLGCDKNRVDTENMLYHLNGSGYELTQRIEDAQVIVVNTCAFINSAREEAVDTILSAASLKPEKLVVTGCLPQKYIGDIYEELPEVDAFLGTGSYDKIVQVLDKLYENNARYNGVQTNVITPAPEKRMLSTPYHYAYLKIAEGCNNHCTYCTIPSIRGKYVSRTMESLLAEAEALAADGVKELILVAQDTTKYGCDLYDRPMLVPLLQKLSQVPGIEWLRVLYCYPENVSEELIEELAANEKLVKYIDIPLQHADSRILKTMGRHVTEEQIRALVRKLRERIPDIAIRSTFIVGFPGESPSEFDTLLRFLREIKLENAGFFAYSREEGTPAAKLSSQITEEEKQRRVQRCYNVQREISRAVNRSRVGSVCRVLYDGIDFDRNILYGRSQYFAPDVDGIVVMHAKKTLEIGKFYPVKITDGGDYDLQGEVLE